MRAILICLVVTSTLLASSDADQTNPSACSEHGYYPSSPIECQDKCGCDRSIMYYYNSTLDECMLDLKHLLSTLVEKFNTEEKIHNEADKVFGRILVSAFFFISCVIICCVLACIYCFRINYTDYRLKKQVKALIKTRKGDQPPTKTASVLSKPQLNPISESCNVIVEDANLFVV